MPTLARRLIAENKKTKATTLDLGNCGLTELPEHFGCIWLEELILSNEWAEYDIKNNNWKGKKSQNRSGPNRIASIAGLEKLGGLKKLVVAKHPKDEGGNWELSDLSPLTTLGNLQQLDCRSTQVSDLSPSPLWKICND